MAFFVATALVNVSNFGFHVIVSRLLGPGSYGGLSTLLIGVLIASVPLGAVQLAATQAQARTTREASIRWITLAGTGGGVLGLVALSGVSPGLERFFHLSSPVPVVLLGVWFLLAAPSAVAMGILIGQRSFRVAALAVLAGALVRLGAGAVLGAVGLGISGAVLATDTGQLASLIVLLVPLRAQLVDPIRESVRLTWTESTLSLAALSGLAVLGGVDTLLARHLMPATSAGYYAAAATAGRIALFAPGAVALIVFPRFVAQHQKGGVSPRVFLQALALVCALGLGAAAVLGVAPSLVVGVLFGHGFAASTGEVAILGLAGAGLGILSFLTYFHVARHSLVALLPWAGAALVVASASDMRELMPHGLAILMTLTVGVCAAVSLMVAVAHVIAGQRTRRPAAQAVVASVAGDVGCDLSVVVPFFNPGPALRPHLEAMLRVLDATGIGYEVIPVSDGCTDGSDHGLDGLPAQVRPVVLVSNQGKGQALRVGLAEGRGRYLGFMDADGDLPADLLRSFVGVVQATEPHFAIGSKRHGGSQVHYPPIRRVYSWGYQQLVHLLFGLSVRDTQTGLKIVSREVLAAVLPRTLEKRYAFDLELLVVARRLGYRNIIELPVVIGERFGTTISWRSVLHIMRDTLAIFYRLHVLRFYDTPPVPAAELAVSLPGATPVTV
ncbi:MAG: glycosyltransferase [Actinomycetes bacterium]